MLHRSTILYFDNGHLMLPVCNKCDLNEDKSLFT